ncbi:MAG: phosphoglycerate mutase [Oscillospiraceae bacterium]|jgi:2,3-bisphosphoglycerate-independent phosphoglycerate mutase|nr:phosphoglycerate mutase [Oscillospiraceae bacterium]
MKHLLIIGDGIADRPISVLGGQTPLAHLPLPGMARLASARMGLVQTVPDGVPPGSDTAILSIFGCDPRDCYTGRAALEAAGAGVLLRAGETCWRVNLTTVEGDALATAKMRSHNGLGIGGEAALETVRALMADADFAALAASLGFVLHESPTFRQMATAPAGGNWGAPLPGPHDHLGEAVGGLLPEGNIRKLVEASFVALKGRQANCIWPWCPGEAMTLPGFAARYGHSGPVVSAVPLVKGIAALCDLPAPEVTGATGELDTNYAGKVEAALAGLRDGADFAAIHVEAPDECSHARDVEGKLEAIRRLDAQVVLPALAGLDALGMPYRVLLLSDHPTLLDSGAHDGAPVPFCLYDSRVSAAPRAFSEAAAAGGELVKEGTQLMELLFAKP